MTRDEARSLLRSELTEWIEARIDMFRDLLEADSLELPTVSDFRLMLCIEDAGNADSHLYYPTVGSDTALHRQIGLTQCILQYLLDPDR